MDEIIKQFGKRVLSISKENFSIKVENNITPNIAPINAPNISSMIAPINGHKVCSKVNKELPSQGEGYMNELKNLLTNRKNGNLILTKKTKPNFIKKEISNPIVYTNLLEELKNRIKKV